MDLATLTAILGCFGTGLSQHARLITLTSAHDVTLPDAPLAERVRGREAVNETYRFDVDALSTSTDLDLAGFIGEELTTTLLQPDGTRRAWHGICTAAEWLGADGGVARYRLRLEPALALLRLRRDSYIFQNKNVEGIVSELFADYPQLRFEFDVTQDMPARAICTQYRESDYDFFVRLMASEGLSWRFEHDQDDVADDGQARHRLVIFDGAAAFPDTPGNPVIRFHGMRATDSDDAIDAFRARRRVQANAVSISSWAPGQLVAPAAEQEPYLDAGEVPVAQVYDGAGERIATDSGAAERLSRLMLQALELDNKLFEGEGAARRLAAGHAFTLTQHDRYPIGENAFKVLWVEHEARNNVGAQIATADAGGVEPGTYRNRFRCVRSVVPVVPRATALPNPHTALGPQTALVVGLPDSVATTTRDHQVRVQFAWQRGAGGNPGSPYHDTDTDGCAPGDDRSGTWVRVAEALAGPNWGSQFTPRVGTEVLVDFIENDIDRPLVVAQLYTGPDAPPFAAGVDSGVDHAGTISGIHTQTFDGAGWNQWQLDDTPGQLRMRLATSMAATQLNLGHLVHQPAGSAQRGAYRGSGFELRTDAWAVVRGGDGVLLTTSARQGLGAGVASTQMDAAEAVNSLKGAQSLDKVLRESATAQHALSSAAAAQAQQDFIAQIDPAAQGKFAGPVNGHDATKAKSGARELDAAAPVERFGKPVVLMDSQAGINWATPASTVLFAGQQLHWTTGADMHMTAAHTLSSVSAEATTLYSDQGGIQAIAANGPVSLQAHTDQLEILADKEVTVISVNDGIEVKAAKKIVLQAGQASVTLEGGDITFACPGTFSVKGAQHSFDGGGRAGATSTALPEQLIGAAAGSLGNALSNSLASQSSARDVDRTLQKFAEEDLKSSARFASLLTGDVNTMSDVPTFEELTLASARGVSWNEALGSQPHDYQTYDGEVGTDAEGRTITQYTRHTSRGYGGGEVWNPPGQMVVPGSDDGAKSSNSLVDIVQNSRTAGFSAVSTWDAYRRVTYKAQAVANSSEYMRKFLELSRSQVSQAKEFAQNAFDARQALRTATQNTLSPGGKIVSMAIEKKYTFEGQYETYAKRAAKLGPYGEMEVYKSIIEASGSSNKLVSKINTFTKYGGPVGIVAGVGVSAYAIAKAPTGQTGLVAAEEVGGFLGGAAGGAAATSIVGGLALGAAAIGVTIAAPVVLAAGAVAGFAGAIYTSSYGREAGAYYYKLGWTQ